MINLEQIEIIKLKTDSKSLQNIVNMILKTAKTYEFSVKLIKKYLNEVLLY